MASLVTAGVVRLKITLNGSPAAPVRLWEVNVTNKYSGATPLWDEPHIIEVTPPLTVISIPSLGAVKYAVRVRAQDVYGNFGSYSSVVEHTTTAGADSLMATTIPDFSIDTITKFASSIRPPEVFATTLPTLPDASRPPGSFAFLGTDGKLYRNVADVWVRSTDGADIVADSITAGSIAAGAIGADELAANIVLASVISTAASGRRVAISVDGIILFDTDGVTKVVVIPTDPLLPVYFAGSVLAQAFITTGTAEMRGANTLAGGSVTTLGSGQGNPTGTAPVLSSGINGVVTLDFTGSGLYSSAFFSVYQDPADSTYWVAASLASAPGSDLYIAHFSSAGAFTAKTLVAAGVGWGHDIAVSSTRWYISATDGVAYTGLKAGGGAAQATHSINGQPGMMWDGTDPILVDASASGSGQMRFRKLNASTMALVSTTTGSGLTINPGSSNTALAEYDGTNWWVVGTVPFGLSQAVMFTTAGVYTADHEFGTVSGHPSPPMKRGIFWTGSVFRGCDDNLDVNEYTTWDWTTASSKYWVAYSWYDITGTTHETTVGPRASITMTRRTRLDVTNATIPGSGGTDEPDRVRVYMLPNATDPGVGGLKLQVTDANVGRILTTYASGGAADPGSNNFPGSTPADLTDVAGTFHLRGDGSFTFPDLSYVEFTGTVSPTATTEGTANTVVTADAVTFDGSTKVEVSFYVPNARADAAGANRNMQVFLYDGSGSIGEMARLVTPAAQNDNKPIYVSRILTPSAAAHTYSIRACVSAGTGALAAGTGGSGNLMPGYIRIRRV